MSVGWGGLFQVFIFSLAADSKNYSDSDLNFRKERGKQDTRGKLRGHLPTVPVTVYNKATRTGTLAET
jgi:hypothetical protein